jgi:hypothetical protein
MSPPPVPAELDHQGHVEAPSALQHETQVTANSV